MLEGKNDMNALDKLRLSASYGAIALVWVNLGLCLLASLVGEGGFSLPLAVCGLAIAAATTGLWWSDRSGPTTRIVVSMALAAQAALLVYASTGSPYQIDMHMYFFALLAICAAWVDWRPIIAYSALVAVHHLVLYMVFPLAVFPGQSDFSRVLLHAVILILQSGALIALTSAMARVFATAEQSASEAIAAHEEAAQRARQMHEAEAQIARERTARAEESAADVAQVERSVDVLAQALRQLSSGNLSHRIADPLHVRIDGLRLSYNESLERLEQVMAQVGIAARTVRGDAASIQTSNDDLARRSEMQAASVEETAAALSQVSETVSGTANLAAEVGRLVENTKSGAERSAGIVTEAVDAMSRIEDSSRQISQIIGVIDEIAFQTNLLALNAGVEAARAGDAGKGFAVVAQEVRELAQRSANAAKEIKALINASAQQVKHGVDLVGETGGALKQIEEEVRHISSQVQAIVRAAGEQSDALRNINTTIGAIDQNTQQNAAMVEESTAAVHSLSGEAQALESLLAQFSVDTPRREPDHRRALRQAA
jgi:methyl-accepting chemotaxis protein